MTSYHIHDDKNGTLWFEGPNGSSKRPRYWERETGGKDFDDTGLTAQERAFVRDYLDNMRD